MQNVADTTATPNTAVVVVVSHPLPPFGRSAIRSAFAESEVPFVLVSLWAI
jgi:hypothetical protein